MIKDIAYNIWQLWYILTDLLRILANLFRVKKYTGYKDPYGKRIYIGSLVKRHNHPAVSNMLYQECGQCQKFCTSTYNVYNCDWGFPVYEFHQSIKNHLDYLEVI